MRVLMIFKKLKTLSTKMRIFSLSQDIKPTKIVVYTQWRCIKLRRDNFYSEDKEKHLQYMMSYKSK